VRENPATLTEPPAWAVAEQAAAFSVEAADVPQAPVPQAAVEGLQQQVAPALVQAVR